MHTKIRRSFLYISRVSDRRAHLILTHVKYLRSSSTEFPLFEIRRARMARILCSQLSWARIVAARYLIEGSVLQKNNTIRMGFFLCQGDNNLFSKHVTMNIYIEDFTEFSGLPENRETSIVHRTRSLMSTFRVQCSYTEYVSKQNLLNYASS